MLSAFFFVIINDWKIKHTQKTPQLKEILEIL